MSGIDGGFWFGANELGGSQAPNAELVPGPNTGSVPDICPSIEFIFTLK
ncbi:hypothetical protein [Rossellomorea aquimaris]|nr:hypothetical protein [Rossellomorea aquimaris]